MQSDIKSVKFKKGLPFEIEVLPIAETVEKHTHTISNPHRAEFYHVFWFQKGTGTYLINFQPIQIKANSFLFVNKNKVQVLDNFSQHDGKLLLFTDGFFVKTEADGKFLKTSILFNDLLAIQVIDTGSSGILETIFNAIEAELAIENDSYHYDILHNLLHNLLLNAERELKKKEISEIKTGVDLEYTLVLKDILETQFKSLKSVSGYAAQMNISEKRLNQATTKTIGKAVKEIIDDRVLLETKRLLVHTNLSVKEIGYELGFEEPTNFIKYFRKHTFKTPTEFRESFNNH
ncbi:helix-turn-helix domain-containing protein [Mucilaginibacter sp. FT3.2]|uniref:helix-turn-helix domain-containing protein n=1 Tax=Mucilaginibacter sp. FT3.2 TaxID=2723090 RepID=UPI001609AFEB|nr:helix-turn-helix domain-containing protein [Mucilaginibacter sp. FT3.2]MBB6232753.1 AraC-like DNA-binding protein/mannose-6-phosphate isomerase-like protein (cupin superfamily) [Mucilaginibacter sp. FT3.2]